MSSDALKKVNGEPERKAASEYTETNPAIARPSGFYQRAVSSEVYGEPEARADLAALYQVLHRLEMTDLIHTHISMRVPNEPEHMLINEFGYQFDEITPANLLKVDFKGNLVLGTTGTYSTDSTGRMPNPSAANFHGGCYLNRPEINCVIHTHTVAGIAVSTMQCGLLPMTQHSLVIHDELGYLEYGGLGASESIERISAATQGKHCFVMKNHGLLALGETAASAFQRIYYLETSCKIQCAALSAHTPLNQISSELVEKVASVHRKRRTKNYGGKQWESMLRMLDRSESINDH